MAPSSTGATNRASIWAVRLLGGLLALIGLVLTIGGAWLVAIGGSPYYALAGVALIASGGLLVLRKPAGAWVYFALYAATLAWAVWEVGLDGWGLVPRVIAPSVLMILVLAAVPALTSARAHRVGALGVLTAFVVLTLGGAVLIGLTPQRAANQAMPTADLAMSDPSPMKVGADWPAYGGTYAARRYSPLAQITPENVGRLQRVWLAHTGDLPSQAAKDKYGAETTPLKVGDSLYLCSAKDILISLDAKNGKERWRYDPRVPDAWIPYTASCRGVAYYAAPGADPAQACATRVIEGTLDGRLIAVDALTGRPCADFGANGQVDIKAGMGRVVPGLVAITAPPVIVRGVVVTGHQVLDGQKLTAPSGVIQGYDAVTGALKWAWDLARPDRNGPPEPNDTYTRGTPNMWTAATGDEALGLVYLPMGNAAVDYWSGARTPLENQYSSALVALDVTTGKPVWSFQTVHKDVWDYDLGSQATLVDLPTQQGLTPALVLPSKQGDIYVLNRRTGESLFGVQERPVPRGGVEPDERSPTQPRSLFHNLRSPPLTERDMWGMSPIDQMACRIQFRRAEYRGIYTPPTTNHHWIEYPSYNGGSDWGGVAVDPRHGVIVANYNDMANYNRLVPRAEAEKKGWRPRVDKPGGDLQPGPEGAGDPQAGAPFAIDVNAGWRMPGTGLLCTEPPYGGIRAIDLRTGRTIWDRPLGKADRNGPFGIPSMLPFDIGTPNNGGSVVTAGGLVFIAAATDDRIRAIDLKTGKTLWTDKLPAGGQATPMTYEADGRQYVVIMAGGHHFMKTPVGDEVIAYALPVGA